MNLHELSPAPGSTQVGKRKGRGHGTGNGKTAGRGHKGQWELFLNFTPLPCVGVFAIRKIFRRNAKRCQTLSISLRIITRTLPPRFIEVGAVNAGFYTQHITHVVIDGHFKVFSFCRICTTMKMIISYPPDESQSRRLPPSDKSRSGCRRACTWRCPPGT